MGSNCFKASQSIDNETEYFRLDYYDNFNHKKESDDKLQCITNLRKSVDDLKMTMNNLANKNELLKEQNLLLEKKNKILEEKNNALNDDRMI
tara:strand:+ start:57 stop:332 length:276 start_codon:yes stop_codon:yes gene_type:complete